MFATDGPPALPLGEWIGRMVVRELITRPLVDDVLRFGQYFPKHKVSKVRGSADMRRLERARIRSRY